MKRQIKASQIKIGDTVEIGDLSGVVLGITDAPRSNGFVFDLGCDVAIADDEDDDTFIVY